AVIFAQGTARDISGVQPDLCYSFGSPNWAYLLSGSACYVPRTAAMRAITGAFFTADCSQYFQDRYESDQWTRPESVLIWGHNPIVANADGFLGHWIVDCMQMGTKTIVVDPRLTWMAGRADVWVRLRPGTDSAVAMGMLNVIIKEGLYDEDFVDRWCYGFDELAERVADYTPDKVAEISWVPEEILYEAARLFATSKPSSVQWGLAVDMTKEAIPAAHAIIALASITGNLDVPGGMLSVFTPFNSTMWVPPDRTKYMSQEQADKFLGPQKYPLIGQGWALTQTEMTIDAMLKGDPYPVRGAMLQTTNPLACTAMEPDSSMVEALKGLDFCVVADIFMTPTAVAAADIVLPAATFPEKDSVRGLWYYLQTINKVTQVGEAKSDVEICLDLAKRFRPDMFPWDTPREWLSAKCEDINMTFEDIQENGPIYPKYEYKKYEKGLERFDGQPGFNTSTGRIELWSVYLNQCGLDPLPYFEEPENGPVSRPDLYEEYPLVLTTGQRNWYSFHSEHRQIERLRHYKPDPQVEIHPETAADMGIENGDWVWIENQHGRFKQRAKLTPVVDYRVVAADHGWWFPEKEAAEPTLYGAYESNPNVLMPWGCGKSGFGSNVKSTLCKIYKVEEGE
ncbi:MAG: molybdopterin-dependent oxidoreductase, partial [Eggerthellaceae bacterium]|nr:molybdopterin-dependent oxidoreductase [Eggerthellaceae bacterium]